MFYVASKRLGKDIYWRTLQAEEVEVDAYGKILKSYRSAGRFVTLTKRS